MIYCHKYQGLFLSVIRKEYQRIKTCKEFYEFNAIITNWGNLYFPKSMFRIISTRMFLNPLLNVVFLIS